MATKYWLGTKTAVAQIANGSIDSVDGTPANNTFTVTIGGEAISQVGDTDVATTAAALVVLLEASTHPYFAAVTWTNPSAGNITGTADVAGCPFVAALTETGAGTGAVTDFSDSTAMESPNDFNESDNWSDGSVPGNSDTIIFRDNSVNVCWGLESVTATNLTVVIEQTYTGKIGLARTAFATTADGDTTDTTKNEYRAHYLQLDMDEIRTGEHYGPGSPSGSQRIKLDNDQAAASTITVFDTATSSSETGLPAVRYLAAHADADVFIRSAPGGIGIASDEPGETSTVGDVWVSDTTSASRVYLGSGVTVTNYQQAGGINVLNAAATVAKVTVDGGTLTMEGDYVLTALDLNNGTVYDNHIKTAGNAITTANLNGGTLDLSQSMGARTLATVNLGLGATLTGDDDIVTITTLNEPDGPYTIAVS